MSLTKHFQIMSVIFFILCVDIIQANIVTDKFRKVGGCGAVSMAPVYHKEMKSTSCIHCLTQCSRIHKCNSVIYQSSTKTCIFYEANEGTCPSTNGRAVNMYKRDTVSSDFLSTVTKDTVTSSTEHIGEGTSHTVQHEGTQNQQSNTLTESSTLSTNIQSTVRSVTTNDNCVNGKYNQGLFYPKTCICNDGFMGESCNERFKSCTDWVKYGIYLKNRDSIQFYTKYSLGYNRQWITIQPPNSPQPFPVQCRCRNGNMDTYIYTNTEKAKYTLDRIWSDMKTGFDFNGGYWIGLNHLYDVYTLENSNELSMKIKWEDLSSLWDPEINLYDDLKIGSETSNYQIQYKSKYVSNYDSSSFSDLNGAMFSAKDQDNDRVSDSNCASTNKRAFWYNEKCRPGADDKILLLIKLRKPCDCWN